VERISTELGIRPEVRLVDVSDEETARRLCFLGSPTIRVAGRDVEPGAQEREIYVLACRIYRGEQALAASRTSVGCTTRLHEKHPGRRVRHRMSGKPLPRPGEALVQRKRS
jgi:hypothetical protein